MARVVVASRSKFVSGLLADAINLAKPAYGIRCADTDKDIFSELRKRRPEFLFIEASFYRRATAEKVLEIISRFSAVRVAVFALDDYDGYFIRRFIRCGIDGYISYREGVGAFRENIKAVLEGRYVIPAEFENDTDGEVLEYRTKLTDREMQIIMLILDGQGNYGAAQALDLAEQTVKNRRKVIYEKLNVDNSIALVKKVLSKGLIPVEEFLATC